MEFAIINAKENFKKENKEIMGQIKGLMTKSFFNAMNQICVHNGRIELVLDGISPLYCMHKGKIYKINKQGDSIDDPIELESPVGIEGEPEATETGAENVLEDPPTGN